MAIASAASLASALRSWALRSALDDFNAAMELV
jgi:hypothetical protein